MRLKKDMYEIHKTKSNLIKQITTITNDFALDHLYVLYVDELEVLLNLLKEKYDN